MQKYCFSFGSYFSRKVSCFVRFRRRLSRVRLPGRLTTSSRKVLMPTSSDGGNFGMVLCDLTKLVLFHSVHAMASIVENENLPEAWLTDFLTVLKAQLFSSLERAAAAFWVLALNFCHTTHLSLCNQSTFDSLVSLSRLAASPYHCQHSQIKSCQIALHKWRMQVRFLHFQKLFWVPLSNYLHWKRLSSAFTNPPTNLGPGVAGVLASKLMQAWACLQYSIHRH